MELNGEQLQAVRAVINEQKSIFLTGEAGCGKSETLKHILAATSVVDPDDPTAPIPVGVTAMTGRAAILIGGKTLHSFLGIGLGKRPVEELVDFTRIKNKKTCQKLRLLKILIIDEVSMLDAELLDKISLYLQRLRGNDAPFGGVQMIFCGDHFQLRSISGQYFFHALEWVRLDPTVCTLTEKFRQAGDTEFQDILSVVRKGDCPPDVLQRLKSTATNTFCIEPTKLYALNADIDVVNELRFAQVSATAPSILTYKRQIIVTGKTKATAPDKAALVKICESARIPESIQLCAGVQVVVTWNIPKVDGSDEPTLVNGTRGEVVSVTPTTVLIRMVNNQLATISYFNYVPDDMPKVEVRFMPLRLAFAMSIHSAQGMTLDCVELDLGSSIFEFGQAYTALSRAKSLDSVCIRKIKASSFKTHPDVLEFGQHRVNRHVNMP